MMTVRELVEALSKWPDNWERPVVVEYGLGANPIVGYHPEYDLYDRETGKRLDLVVLEVG